MMALGTPINPHELAITSMHQMVEGTDPGSISV